MIVFWCSFGACFVGWLIGLAQARADYRERLKVVRLERYRAGLTAGYSAALVDMKVREIKRKRGLK